MLCLLAAPLALSDKCLYLWIRVNPHGIVDPVRGSENRGSAYRLRARANVFAVFTSLGLTVGFASQFYIRIKPRRPRFLAYIRTGVRLYVCTYDFVVRVVLRRRRHQWLNAPVTAKLHRYGRDASRTMELSSCGFDTVRRTSRRRRRMLCRNRVSDVVWRRTPGAGTDQVRLAVVHRNTSRYKK